MILSDKPDYLIGREEGTHLLHPVIHLRRPVPTPIAEVVAVVPLLLVVLRVCELIPDYFLVMRGVFPVRVVVDPQLRVFRPELQEFQAGDSQMFPRLFERVDFKVLLIFALL